MGERVPVQRSVARLPRRAQGRIWRAVAMTAAVLVTATVAPAPFATAKKRTTTTTSTTSTVASSTRVAKKDRPPLVVGARSRADDALLARLYAAALVRRGVRTKTGLRLGNRRAALGALHSGTVDILIDDAVAVQPILAELVSGTSAGSPNTKRKSKSKKAAAAVVEPPPRRGAATSVNELNITIRGAGLVALLPTGAGEKPSVVVRSETATTQKVAKVEELWRISRKGTLGGPPGCETSPGCALGMRREYGIRWDKVRSFGDAQSALNALRAGEIDAAVLDRALELGSGITRLTNDEALLGVHPLVPIVRAERLDPDDRAEVDRVSAALDADAYAELLKMAHTKGTTQNAAVNEWLRERGWETPK